MKKDADIIQTELEEKVTSIMRKFSETLTSRMQNTDDFLSIDELEGLIETTLTNTKLEYLDAAREYLSNVDESSIIKLKKENMPGRE